MESNLTELANMVYSRMQQFWKLDRWVRVTDIEGNPSFQQIGNEVLQNDFELKVMAGSTMPVNKNAMMDLMIRLAQTNAEDGLPVVDRKAILEYLPLSDKKAITDRFTQLVERQKQEQEQQAQQQQQMQQQQFEQQQALKNQEMQTQDRQELANLGGMMQQFLQSLDMTSKQVDELILDKENREKSEYESKIEEKGYKRGVSDGKMQFKEEKEGQIDEGTSNGDTFDGNAMGDFTPVDAESELMRRMDEQQIPDEALEELIQLSQTNPELFKQVIESYPQIAEMLQQDIQTLNGGQI